ncbi:MAG: SAM-dependent methyltransferase [Pseudozobellia sp.]|nr:SAM-dependent methyltransferase [Pseudozobellia sp.]|tara:strand:+ start:4814 stop:5416 length:603 start_codon:yes stop_codon:yes gene_type:complete
MNEFWESNFKEKGEMWGEQPCKSAQLANQFFIENKLNKILVPGIAYGRNAKLFQDNRMHVTGIEISPTAIGIAKRFLDDNTFIYEGSVDHMPFDQDSYDAIYSHALLHLLDEAHRKNFIKACYDQLKSKGFMLFTTISQNARSYRKGEKVGENRFELHKGAPIYFYDNDSLMADFKPYGLIEITEIQEDHPMYLIKCQKS